MQNFQKKYQHQQFWLEIKDTVVQDVNCYFRKDYIPASQSQKYFSFQKLKHHVQWVIFHLLLCAMSDKNHFENSGWLFEEAFIYYYIGYTIGFHPWKEYYG